MSCSPKIESPAIVRNAHLLPQVPPREQAVTIQLSPPEIFCDILSYLDPRSAQAACTVNKYWNLWVIDAAKHREFSLLKKFTVFVYKALEKRNSLPEKIQNLPDVIKNEGKKEYKNLKQIEAAISNLTAIILSVLQSLETEELEDLKKLSIGKNKPRSFSEIEPRFCTKTKPRFFSEMFILAQNRKDVYEKIAVYNAMPIVAHRIHSLDALSWRQVLYAKKAVFYIKKVIEILNIKILKLSEAAKAVTISEIANKVPVSENRGFVLNTAILRSLQEQYFIPAIDAAHAILYDKSKGLALNNIIMTLVQEQCFALAVKVADTIPTDMDKSRALSTISRCLAQNKHVALAIQIAKKIPLDREKRIALINIAESLVRDYNIQNTSLYQDAGLALAIHILNTDPILDNIEKVYALSKISHFLANGGNIKQALKTAVTMDHKIQRTFALESIALIAISSKKAVQRAKDVAMPCEEKETRTLSLVARALMKNKNIASALQFIERISAEMGKAFVLRDISLALAEDGMVKKAIGVANTISDEIQKKHALMDIFLKVFEVITDKTQITSVLGVIVRILVRGGHIEEAKEIANTMQHQPQRERVLRIIERVC